MGDSLQTAVLGMSAYERMLGVAGNNIANADTIAYKGDRITFSEMFARSLDNGTKANERTGGTNPMQVGNGVQVSSIDKNMAGGNFAPSENEFDVAIDGEGFFVVNDGTTDLFTRDGSFDVDARNYLVDPSTGYRVQRTGVVGENNGFQVPGNTDVKIPYDTVLPNSKTEQINFAGNLSGSDFTPTTTKLVASGLTYERNSGAGGGQAVASDEFSEVKQLDAFSDGDTIDISGYARDGSAVSGTFTYGAGNDGTTIDSLLGRIETVFSGAGTSVDATLDDGHIRVESELDGYTRLDVDLSSSAHADSLPGDFAYEEVGGASAQTTNITVFDGQGREHSLTGTFVRHGSTENTWDLVLNDVEGSLALPDRRIAGIQFDDSGTYQGVTEEDGFGNTTATQPELDSDLSVQFGGLSVPQTIGIDFGEAGGYDGLTQFGGDSTAGAVDQDGYSSGSLRSISIDNAGIIRGTFSNGVSLDIAQIGLAVFGNPQGLERAGANYYQRVPATGSVYYTEASSGRAGKVRQGVLEESNVDIAQEFTQLITAQRGFQINSRTVRVANNVLKELASIAV